MSESRFDAVVARIFGEEGGRANDRLDHGGPTNMGITAGTLREAVRDGLVRKDATIDNLTRPEAKLIYFTAYWTAERCPDFPAPLDLLAFDAFVQHRQAAAARLMQVAVGAVPDGLIGDATIAAAHKVELVGAVERYRAARKALYQQIVEGDRSQGRFLLGWLNRVAQITDEARKELAA